MPLKYEKEDSLETFPLIYNVNSRCSSTRIIYIYPSYNDLILTVFHRYEWQK